MVEALRSYYGATILGEEELKESTIKNKIELEYYSIKKEDKLEKNTYGIEVIKKEYKESKVDIEKDTIDNVCRDVNQVNKIMDILKRNTVTPVGLHVVVEELLKQGITK